VVSATARRGCWCHGQRRFTFLEWAHAKGRNATNRHDRARRRPGGAGCGDLRGDYWARGRKSKVPSEPRRRGPHCHRSSTRLRGRWWAGGGAASAQSDRLALSHHRDVLRVARSRRPVRHVCAGQPSGFRPWRGVGAVGNQFVEAAALSLGHRGDHAASPSRWPPPIAAMAASGRDRGGARRVAERRLGSRSWSAIGSLDRIALSVAVKPAGGCGLRSGEPEQ
jgi:hypothetical protein